MKREISCKNNSASSLSFAFLHKRSQAQRGAGVSCCKTGAPRRLTSHRAHLSSVLRRDAPRCVPREKVAGSPADQPCSTLPGAMRRRRRKKMQEQCKRCKLVYFQLTWVYLQHAATKGKTGCHVSCTVAQFMGAYIFI